MSTHNFSADTSKVLEIVTHSLYSNKDIFLRELISNSSDALEKLNYLHLTDEKYKNLELDPKIEITIDKENRVLTLSDTGIGMDKEDLQNNLGTIASSGTKKFLESMSKDKDGNSELIGQFGVGFYSAFIIADKIEVITKKPNEKQAYKWISNAGAEYSIEDTTKESYGTQIKLFLKEGEDEFLEGSKIESLITKFANHIPHKIFLEKEVTNKTEVDGKEVKNTEIKNEQINAATALWRKSKSEVTKDEYNEFYKSSFSDFSKPAFSIHTNAEGTLEYSTLFFIPNTPQMDLYRADFQPGLKLYVKRVFITDKERELLPMYLRFVRGIIDSEDLPLNVSREILQQNIILEKIVKSSTKKILSELKKKLNKKREDYETIWANFGKTIKEGLLSDFENKETILELSLFRSLKQDKLITLKEYKESMKEEQKAIYFITGEDEAVLKNSPLVEKFKSNDIDVLILSDEVDPIAMPQVNEFDKTPLKSVASVDVNEELGLKKEEKKEEEKKEENELTAKIKEFLKDEVGEVKISSRLENSPACIVVDTANPMYQTAMMMKSMGQEMDLPVVLEINLDHKVFTHVSDTNLEDISHVVLDQAKLIEGMKIKDPIAFSNRLNNLISN